MDYMPIQYIRRGLTVITMAHTNIKAWLSRDKKSDDTIEGKREIKIG